VKRALAIGIGLLALAACSPGVLIGAAPSGRFTATAFFTDINALEHHATVELNGVTVGDVSHINVSGDLAKLTLSLKRNAGIPANVTADIRQDSLLGPDVVALSIPGGAPAAPLADNAVITDATNPGKFAPNFESLVKAGNDLLGTLGADGTSALARVIDEGAQGFGSEGGDLRSLLDNLNIVVTGYASQTQTIKTLLDNLSSFASTVGPQAQANATALSNLAQTTAVLDRQKDRLITLLASLNSLAVQGSSLLHADLGEITDQLNSVRSITQALANQQTALATVLVNLYFHNLAVSRGVSKPDDFVQVLNDFVVCGLPGHAGGDVPGSPLNSCFDAGTGKP